MQPEKNKEDTHMETSKEQNMDALDQVAGGTIPDIQIVSGDSGFYPTYQINGNWYTADAITGKV